MGTPRKTMLELVVSGRDATLATRASVNLSPIDILSPPLNDTAFSTPPACMRVSKCLKRETIPGEGARLHAREVALGAVCEHREHLVHARGVAAELEHVLIAEEALESTTITTPRSK